MKEETRALMEDLRRAEALLKEAVSSHMLYPDQAGDGLYGGLQGLLRVFNDPYSFDDGRISSALDALPTPYVERFSEMVKELDAILRNPEKDVRQWFDRLERYRDDGIDDAIGRADRGNAEGVPTDAIESLRGYREAEHIERTERGLRERQLADIAEARRKAQEDAEATQEARKDAEGAAGKTGAVVLGDEFSKEAKSEGDAADQWRRWGVVSFVVLAIAAGVGLVGIELEGTVDLIRRALVGLPLAGLSAYVIREASAHRRIAREYKLTAVKLRTIGAYEDSVSEDARTKLRLALGLKVFGGEMLALEELPDAAIPAIPTNPTDITALVRRTDRSE